MGSLSAPVSAVMLNNPAVVGRQCFVSVYGPLCSLVSPGCAVA